MTEDANVKLLSADYLDEVKFIAMDFYMQNAYGLTYI